MTHKPATAYQYRRVLALVQVLAIRDSAERLTALEKLCHEWGVPPARYRPGYILSSIHQLADAALQHAREEE